MCNAIDWSNVPAYEWTVPAGEAEVTLYFARLSNELRQKLTAGDPTGVETAVGKILKWGGVYSEQSTADFARTLSMLKGCRLETDGDIKSVINLGKADGEGMLKRGNRISSWSKVLSAAYPGKFFIYDSRVALGLCKYKPMYDWYLPPRNGKQNSKIRQSIYAQRKNRNKGDLKDSYVEYLRFLKEAADQIELSTELKAAYDIDNNSSQEMVLAAKMAHLEKMLFMAGDKYQPPEA